MTKKEKIEFTARELFWKHGFKKVSIDEICKKAGVSRKTYYVYYANKMVLILNILEAMTTDVLDKYQKMINDETKSFSQKLIEMLDLKSAMNKELSMEFFADLYQSGLPEVMDYFQSITAKSLQITRDFLQSAQQKGEMNPHLNINFVMWYMQKQMDLINAPEIKTMFTDIKDLTIQFSELIIYGIMPAKK
jgi:AcrR family transcriptional regulator